MKQIGLSVPATANQCDAQRPFFLGRKEARFRRRQSKCTGSACLQEIPSGHMSAFSFCFLGCWLRDRLSATPNAPRVKGDLDNSLRIFGDGTTIKGLLRVLTRTAEIET